MLIAQEDLAGPDIRYFVYPPPVNIGRPQAECLPATTRTETEPPAVRCRDSRFPVGPIHPDSKETGEPADRYRLTRRLGTADAQHSTLKYRHRSG
jgi:hypothetical protein